MRQFTATGTSAQMQQSPESLHLQDRLITRPPLHQSWHVMSPKGHSTFPLLLPAETVETQIGNLQR